MSASGKNKDSCKVKGARPLQRERSKALVKGRKEVRPLQRQKSKTDPDQTNEGHCRQSNTKKPKKLRDQRNEDPYKRVRTWHQQKNK